ncbi:MAG: electron transport complex subunit RsxB [Nitrosomonas sp.]|nr:electron transport complex subunit RsxB [Nitrosomonas sp.]
MNESLIKQIDAILPQTQCGQCGYSGCEPYAKAIVEGKADINQCPPGDEDGIRKIAALLGIEPKPLNIRHGTPKPRIVAVIDETLCIGCTFCIQACPVDAIVGAAKHMHTVLSEECTGCELCVTPCPMDCIDMIPATALSGSTEEIATALQQKANRARLRYQLRQQRQARKKITGNKITARPPLKTQNQSSESDSSEKTNHRKQAIVQAALSRAAAIRTTVIK